MNCTLVHFDHLNVATCQHLPGQLLIFILKPTILGLKTDNLLDRALDNEFTAPQAWQLSRVQRTSRRNLYTCLQDTPILGMNTWAAQDLRIHLLTIITHLTPAIKTVKTINRGPYLRTFFTIIPRGNNPLILDNDSPNSLLKTAGPQLKHVTYGDEILVKTGPVRGDNLLVVSFK